MLKIDISTPKFPGSVLLIDEEDAGLLAGCKWTPDGTPPRIYATRRVQGAPKLYLHREIMRPPAGFVVDHIDRNSLNNTRANLRVVPHKENCWNRGADVRAESQFKGVFRKRSKWAAMFTGRWLGSFDTEMAAAAAYDAAALAAGCNRLGLNFPEAKHG